MLCLETFDTLWSRTSHVLRYVWITVPVLIYASVGNKPLQVNSEISLGILLEPSICSFRCHRSYPEKLQQQKVNEWRVALNLQLLDKWMISLKACSNMQTNSPINTHTHIPSLRSHPVSLLGLAALYLARHSFAANPQLTFSLFAHHVCV